MMGPRPEVLDSPYVTQNEYGDYSLLPDAPPEVVAAFKEYKDSVTADPEPLPSIPPK